MYEQNTSMVAANEQNKFLLPAMVEGDFSRDEIAEDADGLQMMSFQRVKIPAGSVGIAGSQTGVYPIDSPGGWQLIGLTPVRMYDPDRAEPILPKAGEYIKFYSITKAEFDEIAAQEAAGTYVCKRHPRKEGAK